MRLTSDILLSAYCQGIFPMAETRDGEIGWYEPKRRGILELNRLRISRSLAKVVRSGTFMMTLNADFPAVISYCAELREETWISREIERAYTELHYLGYAHSVEAWQEDELVGGLYGVSIGGAFFGESMFHLRRDASKAALVYLVEHMRTRGMSLLDTQFITPHLASLGATEISRDRYLALLGPALRSQSTFSDETPVRPQDSVL